MVESYITELKKEALYTPESLLFLLALQNRHLHPELVHYVTTEFEDAKVLVAKFTTMKNNSIVLKAVSEPLHKQLVSLLKERGVTAKGSDTNKLSYSIKVSSVDTKRALASFVAINPDVTLEQIADAIANHYETGTHLSTLDKYINGDLIMDV